jgi:azurin
MRMSLEKVNGKYQGACYPFYEGFASGLLRLRWGLDGSMFAGMTSRGWASTGKENYALQRLTWNGETPFEMKDIHALPDGLEIEFTLPVEASKLKNAMNYNVNSFIYKYHHQYGSPIINNRIRKIKGIVPSADGRKVKLVLDSVMEGHIHEVKLAGLESTDGKTLLHDFAFYTMNNIPEGPQTELKPDQLVKMSHAGMNHDMHMKSPAKAVNTITAKRKLTMPGDWGQADVTIKLGTKPGLKFDINRFEVKAGAKVRLIFSNNDDMTHNVVVVAPGSADEVGNLALKLGLKGAEMNYVPNSSKVLFHTKILQPDEIESIYFIAPSTPGEYPFICSFPGHASVMRGIIKVVP